MDKKGSDIGSISPAINHILVIRLSAMGDVAMMVPVLAGLLRTYPQLRVTVLTRGFFSPMFSGLPRLRVHEVDTEGRHKGFSGLWRLFGELRNMDIQAIADLHRVLRSSVLRLFFLIRPIPFVQLDKGRKDKKALTASVNKRFLPLKSTHQRYADVFGQLGFPLTIDHLEPLPKREVSDRVKSLLGAHTGPLIGVAPFAAFSGKMYPLERMGEVIGQLSGTGLGTIIFFGGGNAEVRQLDLWESEFEGCINAAGKLSFAEELELISQLRTMVAMDSGNAHLAAMFGVPTITLWGITHPYAGFFPFGQPMENALLADREKYPLIPTSIYGNKFPEGYERVMHTIAPQSVVDRVKSLLADRA